NKRGVAVPTLAEFCRNRVEPWARASFEKATPNSWFWYRAGLRAICDYEPLATLKLSDLTSEKIADFAVHQQSRMRRSTAKTKKSKRSGLAISSVNSSLRVLRRVLGLAVEWGVVESTAKVGLLPGENHRERVISPQEEAKYMAAAREPLSSLATVLFDTGLRPEEAYRLRWESSIRWSAGRH